MKDKTAAEKSGPLTVYHNTGCPIFAADLAERMKERGFTAQTLAARLINKRTGKPLTSRAITQYLGTDTSLESPSAETWKQLNEVFPGLYRPDTISVQEQNEGPSKRKRRAKKAVTTISPVRAVQLDRAITIIDGIAYFEGDEPTYDTAEAAQ